IYAGGWSKGLRHGLGVRRSYLGARSPNIQLQASDDLSVVSAVADKSNQPASAVRQSTPEIGVSVGDSKCADIMVEARASRKAQIGRSIMKRLRKQYSAIELGYSASPGRMSMACMSPVPSSALGPALCSAGTYIRPKETECSAVVVATENSEGSLKVKPPESCDRSTSAVLEVYAGEWYEDKRSGYGVWICSTGLRYLGEWVDNQRHGYGILHYPDGTQDEGQFMANQLSTRVNRKNKIHILRQNKLKDMVELTVVRATAAANEARNISAEQAREK
ncbi:junctophilin, partial [Paragonimus westermani]